MKYRIVGTKGNHHDDFPYELQIQRKIMGIIPYYKHLTVHSTLESAEASMRQHINFNKRHPAPGELVKIYTEEDLLVDKLKGKVV